MMPITLYMMYGAEKEEGMSNLMMMTVVAAAEIPSALICFVLVDNPEYGRKNLMVVSYILVATISFIGAAWL